MREGGFCAETVHGYVRRYPGWFIPGLTVEEARRPFEHDVADLLADRCLHTHFVVGLSHISEQENQVGYQRTLEVLRDRGCQIEVVPLPGPHGCGFMRFGEGMIYNDKVKLHDYYFYRDN